ncbi:hypothetical protein JRQ81_017610 [Phrynocephalus forsythii]|uniref:Large subunit GTPase 1 homolog n=1 Tax=Phrynocephalus forsythii TaxID=171643 RepID=A0A9Q0XT52_9SAUR|nr:hypothetical protein JRQ81_017610 [Phrynocephalus forsythii]
MGGKKQKQKQKQKQKGQAGAAPGLGRALLRHRHRHEGPGSRREGAGWLHTSQLNDGYDWGRLNLQSVTEQDSLEEFLATAELAGTEFVAEKLNIKIVPAEAHNGLPTAEETKKIQELQEENKQFLCIPRRPPWDKHTSPEVLSQAERESFLEWRRQLARLEEEQKLLLTPFERNLDFWRQLWRVLERSDVVVQIVDARNPLLFRCQDLELYVREISPEKENLILLNKADLLSKDQRSAWARFFEQEGVKVVFWSALEEGRQLAAAPKGTEAVEEPGGEAESSRWRDQRAAFSSSSSQEESEPDSPSNGESDHEEDSDVYEDCEEEEEEEEAWRTCSEEEESRTEPSGSRGNGMELQAAPQDGPVRNSSCLLPREKLLETFRRVHAGKRKVREGEVTVGLVSHPPLPVSPGGSRLCALQGVGVAVALALAPVPGGLGGSGIPSQSGSRRKAARVAEEAKSLSSRWQLAKEVLDPWLEA